MGDIRRCLLFFAPIRAKNNQIRTLITPGKNKKPLNFSELRGFSVPVVEIFSEPFLKDLELIWELRKIVAPELFKNNE